MMSRQEMELWPSNSCCIHRQGDYGPNFSLDGFFFRGSECEKTIRGRLYDYSCCLSLDYSLMCLDWTCCGAPTICPACHLVYVCVCARVRLCVCVLPS